MKDRDSKVCLINSNFYDDIFFKDNYILPMGLLMLGAVLEKEKFAVEIIDLPWLVKQKRLILNKRFTLEAAKFIVNKHIKILGFNTRCNTYPIVIDIAKKCKELKSDIVVIFGGPQATFTDKKTLKNFPFIDIIVRFEGELTMLDLMHNLKHGLNLEHVRGITFRNKSGKIIRNKERDLIKDLDSLPYPAYRLVEKNISESKTFFWPILDSRGCPGKCIFCCTSLMNCRYSRARRIQDIMNEINLIKKRYKVRNFRFLHDQFLSNKTRAKKISEFLVKKKIKIAWSCSARLDCLNARLLEKMSRAGCKHIYFGIESGSSRIQKIIRKNLNISYVFDILKLCDKYNIVTTLSFIIGFPEEKEADVNKTLYMALRCRIFTNSHIQLHLLSPMAGTPLWKKYKEKIIFTNLFSDLTDGYASKYKSWISLIKQYPELFSSFYTIMPKYIPLTLPYRAVRLFEKLLSIFPVSCIIILKDMNWKPTDLIYEFNKWRKKKIKKGNKTYNLCSIEAKKIIPLFFSYIYKTKMSSRENFLNYILNSEIVHYSTKTY